MYVAFFASAAELATRAAHTSALPASSNFRTDYLPPLNGAATIAEEFWIALRKCAPGKNNKLLRCCRERLHVKGAPMNRAVMRCLAGGGSGRSKSAGAAGRSRNFRCC